MLTKLKTVIKSNKLFILSTIIIILLVIVIDSFCYKGYQNSKERKEEEQISSFFELQEEKEDITSKNQDTRKETEEEEFVGILSIPSIQLKKGFYNINSKKNTVDVGLEVLKGSRMPNEDNSSLVIAGHSGTGYLAFFKDLDKVEKGSLIDVYYNQMKYTYQLEETTITEKTGEIKIEKEADSQTLILTTCNPKNRDKEQLTLIASLIKKEKYK